MKKIALTVFLLLLIVSCKKENKKPDTNVDEVISVADEHSDESSGSDWKGSYVGILPCENSCLGVNTEIVLNLDNTYTKSMLFIGDNQKTVSEQGSFIWLEDNSVILLDDKTKTQLKVDENFITVLDKNGKAFTGKNASDYILYKNICESKDFDEYTLKDNTGKKYMVTYGSGCDGSFVEIELDGVKHHLCLKSSSNGSSFEDEQGVRFVEKDDTTTLYIDGKEIVLTTI